MISFQKLKKKDPAIFSLIEKERKRQKTTLNLIASENYPSLAVREALASILVAKYSEGRPYHRYYGGMENIDQLETLVEKRAQKVFLKGQKGYSVNVQPYSGSPANYAVLRGLLLRGDKIMSLALPHGGHLSHGHKITLAGQDFKIVNYLVDKKTLVLNYKDIFRQAQKEKPKMIIAGYSAYPRKVDFRKFKEIAGSVGSFLLADISHIAGFVASGLHPSPFPFADVVMTTTHKTLRGPRGAITICRDRLKDKIFPVVFPGIQGGPHNHTIAAIGVALKEAMSPQFKKYALQIIKNAKVLAEVLSKRGFNLVSGGTDTHLILIDLADKGLSGKEAQNMLEKAGIVVNKNTVPYEGRSPFDPSGIRLGTAALTTRGMKEKEMKKTGELIAGVLLNQIKIAEAKKGVAGICQNFPIP